MKFDVRVNLITKLQFEIPIALVVDSWKLLAYFDFLVLGLVADHWNVVILEALERGFSVVRCGSNKRPSPLRSKVM